MSEAEIGTFRLRVLGGYALDGTSGAAAPVFPKRRPEAVLAVLAVCGDLGCTRERLLAMLWPESDDASARHGLRDALHIIRRTLGAGAVPSAGRLLRLDPAVVASDVGQFSQALVGGPARRRRPPVRRAAPRRLPRGRRCGVRALAGWGASTSGAGVRGGPQAAGDGGRSRRGLGRSGRVVGPGSRAGSPELPPGAPPDAGAGRHGRSGQRHSGRRGSRASVSGRVRPRAGPRGPRYHGADPQGGAARHAGDGRAGNTHAAGRTTT